MRYALHVMLWLLLSTFVFMVGCAGKMDEKAFQPSEQFLQKLNIEQYMNSQIGFTSQGGQLYSAFEVLGYEAGDEQITLYLWVLCKEYAKTGEGSGISVPISVTIGKKDGQYTIISHQMPRDGDLYAEDIKKIFPKDVQNKFNDVQAHNDLVSKLDEQIRQKVNQHRPK